MGLYPWMHVTYKSITFIPQHLHQHLFFIIIIHTSGKYNSDTGLEALSNVFSMAEIVVISYRKANQTEMYKVDNLEWLLAWEDFELMFTGNIVLLLLRMASHEWYYSFLITSDEICIA